MQDAAAPFFIGNFFRSRYRHGYVVRLGHPSFCVGRFRRAHRLGGRGRRGGGAGRGERRGAHALARRADDLLQCPSRGHGALGTDRKALPRAAPGVGTAVPLVPERSGAGRGAFLQHERKSARARQCRHACRHPRRAAAARALRRRGGVRRAVPSRRTQHRVHPAPPDDRRGAALGLRRGKRVRYSARGVDIVCGGRGLAERLFRRAP